MIPAGHWLPRRFAACQRDRRHPAVSLTRPASGEPSPTGANHIVLTGRVPQAAVTSGIQRSVTVTPRGPLSGPSAPDQGKRSGPKLHGMQGGSMVRFGAVALRRSGILRRSVLGPESDRRCQLVERDRYPLVRWRVHRQLVVSASNVRDEGMPHDDGPGAMVLLEPSHRSQPRFQPTMVALDAVVGVVSVRCHAAGSSSSSTAEYGRA